jgi:hypothetical protein
LAKYKAVLDFDDLVKHLDAHISNSQLKVIKSIKKNQEFTSREFLSNNLDLIDPNRTKGIGNRQTFVSRCLKTCISIGLVEKLETIPVISFDDFLKLDTISYWLSQIRGSKFKNITSNKKNGGTRIQYAYHVWKFNNWLHGKKFLLSRSRQVSTTTFERTQSEITFDSIEQMISIMQEPYSVDADFIKIIKKYLLDPIHDGKSSNSITISHYAIKSYFEKNDFPLVFKFNSKVKYDSNGVDPDDIIMTLTDFHNILSNGSPTVLEKALFLCKFHRGLDTSTLVDRFNFEVYLRS